MRYLLLVPILACIAANISCNEVHGQPPQPSRIPTLTVETDSGKTTLQIDKLDIQVTVTGNIASTSFDITFYNPFDRIMEGAFEFPLAEGQSVYRYGLDINGKLREGVVVEKEKARVAYESTVRRGIDPGLVEKTKGNSYRTRIYPIPAKGYKRVVIGIEQALQYLDKELLYTLPVHSTTPVSSVSVQATVYNSAEPLRKGLTPHEFSFSSKRNDWTAAYNEKNQPANFEISFAVPFAPESPVMSFTGTRDDKNYFYLALPLQQDYIEKKLPNAVTILWDISGSGRNRDIKKELALLKAYLDKLDNASVALIPFNNVQHPPEKFNTADGTEALVDRIRKFDYDGGTQLGAVSLTGINTDQVLLFTDGISTFGKQAMDKMAVPVAVINSAATADHAYMKYIAKQSNGIYINLESIDNDEALRSLVYTPLQFISAEYDKHAISEVYASAANNRGGFSIAGLLETPSAAIKLHFGYGNTIVSSVNYTITKDDEAIPGIERHWAALKIDELEMQPKQNREAITELGKAFSIVTSNTSLLVLDRVEDYVQYKIAPPQELRVAYDSLLHQQTIAEDMAKRTSLDEPLAVMEQLKHWYHTPFIKKIQRPGLEKIKLPATEIAGTVPVMEESSTAVAYEANMTDSAVTPGTAGSFSAQRRTAANARMTYSTTYRNAENLAARSYDWKDKADGLVAGYTGDDEGRSKSSIDLQEWKPNATYLAQMEKTTPVNYYKTYLSLKKKHGEQPAFFADMARFFYSHGNRSLALQVLSNIAEMKLEDAELLRILGHQLIEWNEKELAIATFTEVQDIRGEHPQAWRDLALAHAEAGHYQQAADLLYHVITTSWDARFDKVTGIAINEFNAIISAQQQKVNTSAYDKRFIYPMPVDVRIVIAWSSDDSDIDLWVTDPLNEKCDYTYQLTKGGGRLSGDITQGFGPEEYSMKQAANGDYVVQVNYFGDRRQTLAGPITIKADLYTHYGTPQQQKQTINFRLTSAKETIKLGVLKFGGK